MPKAAPVSKGSSKAPAKASAKGAAKGASKAPVKGASKAGAKGGVSKKRVSSFAKHRALRSKYNALYVARPRSFLLGQNLPPKRDLTRFVRWPKYVRLQRQKVIMMKRLKVPPTLNQFNQTLDKPTATTLFKLLNKYRPEDKAAKSARLSKIAEAKAKGEKVAKAAKGAARYATKFGINNVATLVEAKRAKLVVIAHDVDPIEVVVWLPALCRKMEVPYVIVKGKSRLGHIVGLKTATALALVDIKPEHKKELEQLSAAAMSAFNDNAEGRKQWGGSRLGPKSQAQVNKRKRILAKEGAITKAPRV
eukprot:TRINITY_DN436_c0_g1_i1.p1 TRINITY_DN436_c0_g1~~TRINITY_DN436_c0_g1_i1.p1  ORF type:complete len:306 (+),score=123.17 TRINITY_DN436_c0_g1_i1:153-1070(+)